MQNDIVVSGEFRIYNNKFEQTWELKFYELNAERDWINSLNNKHGVINATNRLEGKLVVFEDYIKHE